MILKLYNGLKNFLEPITVIKETTVDPDAIRPIRNDTRYEVLGSIALFDGTEDAFRPGGKVQVGDLYIQVLAGKTPATRVQMPLDIPEEAKTEIEISTGDKIEYLGDLYEIYYVRNEPSVCDVADCYASKQEVSEDA